MLPAWDNPPRRQWADARPARHGWRPGQRHHAGRRRASPPSRAPSRPTSPSPAPRPISPCSSSNGRRSARWRRRATPPRSPRGTARLPGSTDSHGWVGSREGRTKGIHPTKERPGWPRRATRSTSTASSLSCSTRCGWQSPAHRSSSRVPPRHHVHRAVHIARVVAAGGLLRHAVGGGREHRPDDQLPPRHTAPTSETAARSGSFTPPRGWCSPALGLLLAAVTGAVFLVTDLLYGLGPSLVVGALSRCLVPLVLVRLPGG